MITGAWIAVNKLHERFAANLRALATRYPALAQRLSVFSPSQSYFLFAAGDEILLGTGNGQTVQTLPRVVSTADAVTIAGQLYPSHRCAVACAVAGEDLGWLWNTVYQLPCDVQIAPGHRPPLFFLMRDLERFWVILHIQDWQTLLADNRVRLFISTTAMEEFRRSLVEDSLCPWPKVSITVDPALWPKELSLDSVLAEAQAGAMAKMKSLWQQLAVIYRNTTPASLAARFQSKAPLRILGLTSRFTTFLQYSMVDWLHSFEHLGHQTKLVIEEADHQMTNSICLTAAYADFKPDLVVVIDHYRAEYTGIPDQIPFVMWIQDRLPNIFSPQAGPAQGRVDYVVGYGKQECVTRFGYPASRFVPSMIGVDENRFLPRTLSRPETAEYTCDVSFVSHASTPADVIVKAEIERLNSPDAARLLNGTFDLLKAVYDADGAVTEPSAIRKLIERAMAETSTTLPEIQIPHLTDFFTQRVNNAMFRHQTLHWLSRMDVNLHLYGKGWENHPQFKRFARGVADNQTQLSAIYQATAINLQVTPYGSAHQRLFDGLAAGGFFLLRSVPGDQIELLQRKLWKWCTDHHITSGQKLLTAMDDPIRAILFEIGELRHLDPLADIDYFFAGLEEAASGDFTRTAATLWKEFDRVAFSSRESLTRLVQHFLPSPHERQQIAQSMRQRVIETHTYTATTRRLLNLITTDLAQGQTKLRASA